MSSSVRVLRVRRDFRPTATRLAALLNGAAVRFAADMEVLTDREINDVLINGRVAHVAVVDGDKPYVSGMSYVAWDGGMAFRTLEGRRVQALRVNPNVSIEVSEYDETTGDWRSVIVAGTATVVEDHVEAGDLISRLLQKYADSFDVLLGISDRMPAQEAYVVKVDITEQTGRRSGERFGPKTRPGRL